MYKIQRLNGNRKSTIASAQSLDEAKLIANEKIKKIGEFTETPNGDLKAPVDGDLYFGVLITKVKEDTKPHRPIRRPSHFRRGDGLDPESPDAVMADYESGRVKDSNNDGKALPADHPDNFWNR